MNDLLLRRDSSDADVIRAVIHTDIEYSEHFLQTLRKPSVSASEKISNAVGIFKGYGLRKTVELLENHVRVERATNEITRLQFERIELIDNAKKERFRKNQELYLKCLKLMIEISLKDHEYRTIEDTKFNNDLTAQVARLELLAKIDSFAGGHSAQAYASELAKARADYDRCVWDIENTDCSATEKQNRKADVRRQFDEHMRTFGLGAAPQPPPVIDFFVVRDELIAQIRGYEKERDDRLREIETKDYRQEEKEMFKRQSRTQCERQCSLIYQKIRDLT